MKRGATKGPLDNRKEVAIMYNYTIKEQDLIRTIRNAAEHGYNAMIYINGEYYDIELNDIKLYFINNDVEPETIYGTVRPYCMTEKEIERLSVEWDTDLMKSMHEATKKEVLIYGKGRF